MFRRKPRGIEVYRPMPGNLVALADVPDPVFAQEVMGPGFAVDPTSGTVVSPVAGTILVLAETMHAFAVRTAEGVELLVHVGLDTVTLKGEGFRALHQVGDTVAAGEPVLEVDLDAIRDRVPSLLSPVILTNHAAFSFVDLDLSAGDGSPVAVVAPA